MPTTQAPIHSGFGFDTTADEVISRIDLSGKTAVVTGGYSGIGLETVRVLVSAGAEVIVPARDMEKASAALGSQPNVQIRPLDLLAPDSIDAFAAAFERSGRALHLLVNNAGIMATPLARDGRGRESQLSANHLGHFHLTRRLWRALQRAQGARVIALSSGAHRRAAFDFDDPDFTVSDYDPWIAYARSKTATALFAVELDRLGAPDGIRAFSVHPGRIETGLQRHIGIAQLQAMGFRNEQGEIPAEQAHLYKTIAQGAATTVWCATHPVLRDMGGVYCEDVDIAPSVDADHKSLNGVLPWARDEQLAQRLWSLSESWIEQRA